MRARPTTNPELQTPVHTEMQNALKVRNVIARCLSNDHELDAFFRAFCISTCLAALFRHAVLRQPGRIQGYGRPRLA